MVTRSCHNRPDSQAKVYHDRHVQYRFRPTVWWQGSSQHLDRCKESNCLELLSVHLPLKALHLELQNHHVLVCKDNIELWCGFAAWQEVPGERRLCSQTVMMIFKRMDLFASEENIHCPIFCSMLRADLRVGALMHKWQRTHKNAFPPVKILHLVIWEMVIRDHPADSTEMAQSSVVPRDRGTACCRSVAHIAEEYVAVIAANHVPVYDWPFSWENSPSIFSALQNSFLCYGGLTKGLPVSKQRLSHWLVDAISLTYDSQGLHCLILDPILQEEWFPPGH